LTLSVKFAAYEVFTSIIKDCLDTVHTVSKIERQREPVIAVSAGPE